MAIETPEITQVEHQLTAVIHLTIPMEEMPQVMGPAIEEVMSTVGAQGFTPAGPWFTHHFSIAAGSTDFEVGVPVPEPITPKGRVRPGERPAMSAARTVYRGPYEGLMDAWGAFDAWVTEHGRPAGSDLWEYYAKGPESGDDSSEFMTELLRPLAG
jgi:effector-binding domain-containing protein